MSQIHEELAQNEFSYEITKAELNETMTLASLYLYKQLG